MGRGAAEVTESFAWCSKHAHAILRAKLCRYDLVGAGVALGSTNVIGVRLGMCK